MRLMPLLLIPVLGFSSLFIGLLVNAPAQYLASALKESSDFSISEPKGSLLVGKGRLFFHRTPVGDISWDKGQVTVSFPEGTVSGQIIPLLNGFELSSISGATGKGVVSKMLYKDVDADILFNKLGLRYEEDSIYLIDGELVIDQLSVAGQVYEPIRAKAIQGEPSVNIVYRDKYWKLDGRLDFTESSVGYDLRSTGQYPIWLKSLDSKEKNGVLNSKGEYQF